MSSRRPPNAAARAPKKGVAWQQPLLTAVQQGLTAAAKHAEGPSPLRTAAQALLHYAPALQPPRLEAPADIEASLLETAPDGSAKLNVRVVEAVDRSDFGGKPYVAFVLRCRFGDREWMLEKRFSKFHCLHEQLAALVGRDLAARLPSLPPRLPSWLGQKLGCSAREVQERRLQLDLYMIELTRLAAASCEPLEAHDASAGDDDNLHNMLHVLHELYRYVEFVGHVVPGKGDRALDDDEDNSDEDIENESQFQSPALVFALGQVKRLRDQLVDKQLAIDSARELKQQLGQQLVETQAEVEQLEQTLTRTSDDIEAVLCEQHQRQQQMASAAKEKGAGRPEERRQPVARLADASHGPAGYSPFAAAAAAVSNRFAQHRLQSAPAATPAPALLQSTSPVPQPGEASRHVQGPHGSVHGMGTHDPKAGRSAALGGDSKGEGVDGFAMAVYGIRGKLESLKEQHFCQRRSWVSIWKGKSHDDAQWRELESEVRDLSLSLDCGPCGFGNQEDVVAAQSRLERSCQGNDLATKVERCLKITALGVLKDNIALWKSLGELAAAKRRAVDKMAAMSIEGAWVGRRPSTSQEPRTLFASIRSLTLPSSRSLPQSSPAVSHGSTMSTPAAPRGHAQTRAPLSPPATSSQTPSPEQRGHSLRKSGTVGQQGQGVVEKGEPVKEGIDFGHFELKADLASLSPSTPSIRDRMSSLVMRARTSLGSRRGTQPGVSTDGSPASRFSPGFRSDGLVLGPVGDGKMTAGDWAEGSAGPDGGPSTGGLAARRDVATDVGDLARTLEEGVYLMTSELEDIAQSRSSLQEEIAAATHKLAQLQAELVQVQGERDDAMTRAHAYAAVTRSMAEHERYLTLEKDGLLSDESHPFSE